MKKFTLKIKDLSSIVVYTDIDSISNKLMYNEESLTKTIPATVTYDGEVDDILDRENYISILSFDKKMIDVNKDENVAHLFSPKDQFFFPDLVYLALGMFANDLQRDGYHFVQSSVVKYDDNNSIMLIGDPNAGKTTLAFSLMKNNKYKLISNDNVLVKVDEGKLKTYCGTKKVQMRYGGIKLYFPELLPHVSIPEEDKGRDDWDIKLYIDDYLQENGYQYADESVVTDIYNISTFKAGDSFIRGRENIDEILLIYEHLTKQIRSNRYALTGFNFPLPSFEDGKYTKKRYRDATVICDNTNVYDARGTIDDLSKKLVKKK